MADEDEDVVFMHSALYNHLKNVGYEEEDVLLEQRNIQQEFQLHETDGSSKLENADTQKSSNIRCGALSHLKRLKQEIETKCGQEFCQEVLALDVLEDEDKNFLYNFLEDGILSKVEPASSHAGSWLPVTCAVLTTGYVLSRLFTPEIYNTSSMPVSVTDAGACLVSAAGVGPRLTQFLAKIWMHRKCSKHMQCLRKTVNTVKALKKLCRKAIRLIQETELVARGFTLVSQGGQLSWLERGAGSQRQCPELRKLVFHRCRSLLLLSRQTTLTLIQRCQVAGEVLAGGSYLADIPLEEYGPLVLEENELNLKNATDNYSISAIKAMYQLQNWYTSEMLRRLVLGILLQDAQTEVSALTLSQEIMSNIDGKLEEHLNSVQLSVHLHQCSYLDSNAALDSKTPHASHATSVYSAVHSLSLHLQAALKKVRTLEEQLEPTCSNNDLGDLPPQLKETVTSHLQHVLHDLDSCRDCLDEGICRIEKRPLYHKNEEPKVEEVETNQDLKDTENERTADLDNPVILDQVFEAYTDPNEVEEDMYDPELLFSEEERERRKQERKNAKKVIRELNKMIHIREQDKNRERRIIEPEIQDAKIHDDTQGDAKHDDNISDDEDSNQTKRNPYHDMMKEYEQRWNEAGADLKAKQESEDEAELLNNDLKSKRKNTDSSKILPSINSQSKLEDGTRENVSSAEISKQDLGAGDSEITHDLQRGKTSHAQNEENNEENLASLKQRLQQLPGVGFGFSANVAALASQRSQQMGVQSETFGDSDEEQ